MDIFAVSDLEGVEERAKPSEGLGRWHPESLHVAHEMARDKQRIANTDHHEYDRTDQHHLVVFGRATQRVRVGDEGTTNGARIWVGRGSVVGKQ